MKILHHILITIMYTLLLLSLGGCDGFDKRTPAALPTVVLDTGATPDKNEVAPDSSTSGEGVSASGVLVPERVVQMSFSSAGKVLEVQAGNGDFVRKGTVLAQLGGIESFQAAVNAARLELLSAEKALDDLEAGGDQARADAQVRLALAQERLDQAEARHSWKDIRVGNRNQIDLAHANYIIAAEQLEKAEETYSALADSPEDSLIRAQALTALATARTARDKALANLNYLLSLPNEIEVGKTDAELGAAQAELATAQREYERLKDGPDAQLLAIAKARVDNAKSQLQASEAAISGLTLTAPFDGTVSRVEIRAGEWASPGQTVLVVADLSKLQAETTDLSERDIIKIREGLKASVFVKATGETLSGQVKEVSPLADSLGGDVVYKTVISLDQLTEELRAGMSVDVTIFSN